MMTQSSGDVGGYNTPTPYAAVSKSDPVSTISASSMWTASTASSAAMSKPVIWEQDVRIECIRKMRNGSKSARKLFAIVNQKSPLQLWTDIRVMGDDCKHLGMVIADTVDCMIEYIDTDNSQIQDPCQLHD